MNPLMTSLRVDCPGQRPGRPICWWSVRELVDSIGYNRAGILGAWAIAPPHCCFWRCPTILNIFLDLALVLAVPLGVLGVALGTVIAQLCSWLFGIWYINRGYPLAIHPFNGIFDRKLFCEIIRIGLPSGIQMSLVAWAPWAYSPRSTATERPSPLASTWAINWNPVLMPVKAWPPL